MLIDKVPWVAHMLGRGQVRVGLLFGLKVWREKEGGVVGCVGCASTSLLPTTYVSSLHLFVASLRYI